MPDIIAQDNYKNIKFGLKVMHFLLLMFISNMINHAIFN